MFQKKYYDFNNLVSSLQNLFTKGISVENYKQVFRSLEKFILFFYDHNVHGKALENLFNLFRDFDKSAALNLADQCLKLLNRKTHSNLEPNLRKVLEAVLSSPNLKSETQNRISKDYKCQNIIKISEKKKKPERIDISKKLVTNQMLEEIELTITKINFDKQIVQNDSNLITRLLDLSKKLLFYKGKKDYDQISNLIDKAFSTLTEVNVDAAIKLASWCANKKPELNDTENILSKLCETIVKKTLDNDQLSIPFRLICVEKSLGIQEHIAQYVIKKYEEDAEKLETFLIGCSRINNTFCQDMLQKYAQQNPSLALVKACAENLGDSFSMYGNRAVVFEACKDLHKKEEKTKDFLLPIAIQILETYKKIEEMSDCFWLDDLLESIQKAESEVAYEIISLVFNIYLCTNDQKNMKFFLNDCFKINKLKDFYSKATSTLIQKEEWKDLGLEIQGNEILSLSNL